MQRNFNPLINYFIVGFLAFSGFAFAEDKNNVAILKETKQCINCLFDGDDLSGLNLVGAKLSGSKFYNVDLNGTRLTDADLTRTSFENTNLQEAILNRSNFSYSTFQKSDFSNTLLLETNFTSVSFSEVNFNGAKLRNTVLTSTELRDVDFREATIDLWIGDNVLYCDVIDNSNNVIDRDCRVFEQKEIEKITAIQTTLSQLGYEVGKIDGAWGKKTEAALRSFFNNSNVNVPSDLKSVPLSLLEELSGSTQLAKADSRPRSNTALDLQDGLFALGYNITPDGNIGPKTRKIIGNFLNVNSLAIENKDLRQIRDSVEESLVKQSIDSAVKLPWEYKAAEITIDADPNATEVFKGLETMKQAADAGFTVISLFVHCDRRESIDKNATDGFPLYRRTGCSIPYVKTTDDLLAQSVDATDVYIAEAKKLGLKITLKPMFLGLTDAETFNYYGYEYGKVPVKEFFDGNGSTFDGYVEIIQKISSYANEKNVDFVQIGTELKNLNPNIIKSDRWGEIIKGIRKEFGGKLIYAYNLGPEGSGERSLQQIKAIWEGVDYIGINFFPNQTLKSKKYYTSADVTNALQNVVFDGKNAFSILKSVSTNFNKAIIFTETSFPPWRGSVNWMFRQSCDYQNKGKKGWIYTVGPFSTKEPSRIAALVLADGWFKAVKDLDFVHGATHVFWYKTGYDGKNFQKVDEEIGFTDCGGHIARNESLINIISAYYN